MMQIEHEKLASMSLGDHLEELRIRLMLAIGGVFAGMIIGMILAGRLISFLVAQYRGIMEEAGKEPSMQFIEMADPIIVYLKISLFIGVVIAAPWIIYQLWAFVASGLYNHEKKFMKTVTPACTILFLTGAAFFFKFVGPMAIRFFVKLDYGSDFLSYNPTLRSYISFLLTLTIVFGLGFQLPIVIIFANKIGIVTVDMLKQGRKYVIMGLFIVAAVITPPDVFSQIALAVPMFFLYEASIIFCQIAAKKKAEKEESDSTDNTE
ncbi:Sec-independent protein translocase protein TatCy [Anaerohalosphaera lusitana]|uniref:Sec-independent protein translocase protein TatC n=1 Tax=Anaerohalosphaera lusitana TaxID=1936003 RepID=A0A1U9NKU9_9BACT|nr:twin-arginine translocase subunit TatC [Anaerohalosphaera lusitana]AQT68572.1 Sec-independent protein translocase protein TatCy [Anaerohalosphaera lusitana]